MGHLASVICDWISFVFYLFVFAVAQNNDPYETCSTFINIFGTVLLLYNSWNFPIISLRIFKYGVSNA